MEIAQTSAEDMCSRVVNRLVAWPVLPALLQIGGIESRGSSRILLALEEWLEHQKRADLLIVPELRLSNGPSTDETTDNVVTKAADQFLRRKRIDYALVHKNSVSDARLRVDTVIEVKTNYLCQGDLKVRPLAAVNQARSYARACGAQDCYVLYIVASAIGMAPTGDRDAGWTYYTPEQTVVGDMGPITAPGVQVIGSNGTTVPGMPLGFTAHVWATLLQGGV